MLKNRQELIAYREDSVKAYAAQTKKIIVCAGTGCVAGGSLHIHAKLNEIMQAKGLPVAVELMVDPHGEEIGLKKSGCHGVCEMGTLVRIEPQGWLYTKVKVEDCDEIVEKTIVGG
jgi:NADH-quinone oxidoreductase subunit F